MEGIGNASVPIDRAEAVPAEKKWRCDVCKAKYFADFDKACAHEVECQKIFDAKKAAEASLTSTTNSAAALSSTLVTQDTLDILEPKREAAVPSREAAEPGSGEAGPGRDGAARARSCDAGHCEL